VVAKPEKAAGKKIRLHHKKKTNLKRALKEKRYQGEKVTKRRKLSSMAMVPMPE